VNTKPVIYLDSAATMPIEARVCSVMTEWQMNPGNAHVRHHAYGAGAAQAVAKARMQVARSVGAGAEEIIFTSGATEANNTFLAGLAAHLRAAGKTHIITCAVEHASVLEPLKALEGFTLTILPVKPCGMIEADMIVRALTAQTGLVSIQAVNNEVGVIQPLDEISAILKGRDILFHTDAAQALGKMNFNVTEAGVDFASLSAHKMGGPQGIGALYVKAGCETLLQPLHYGGGQEQGLRSGTLPVALCVGFGAACDILKDNRSWLQAMRETFLKRIEALQPVIYGHSDPAWNVPGILNIRFPGIDNETLIMALPGLAFGVGSACSRTGNKLSSVIQTIAGEQAARESIRLSWGGLTGMVELQKAADEIIGAVTEIKKLQEVA